MKNNFIKLYIFHIIFIIIIFEFFIQILIPSATFLILYSYFAIYLSKYIHLYGA